jgi:hypothetical protein
MQTDKRILSIAAFALLLVGVFAPLMPRFFPSGDVAVIAGIAAIVLALLFGFIGRDFLLGRVAAIGALILCLVGGVNYVGFTFGKKSAEARMKAIEPLRTK